jgi:hypothetical protein
MFNSGIRGKRATDNQATINPQNKFIQTVYPQPYISGYAISGSDDTALDPAGGQTVLVNGTGFIAGVSATLAGTQIASVTLVSSTQISFTSPAKAGGSYSLVVYNSTGGAAILVPGLTYSSVPTFTTAAGSIGSFYETTAISTSVVATSDSAITYSLSSGSLPSGATLYGNGVITGTSPIDSSSTTYTFNITATDAELQDVTRTFTLTINTDVVSWSTPADGTNYILIGNSPISNVALSATSAAGYGVTYAANALPTGLSLNGSTISGTPTVEQTVSTLLTATANTTSRTSTRTVSWTVTLGDAYWKYTSLLLNATTPTPTFINDASLNNFQLTIQGDTKPSNFDPYTPGYYSNYFDGTGDYLSAPANAAFQLTGDFTVEAWVYMTTINSFNMIFGADNGASSDYFVIRSTTIELAISNAAYPAWSFTFATGVWYHVAVTRNSNTLKAFVNGTQLTLAAGSATNSSQYFQSSVAMLLGRYGNTSTPYYFTGYISNARIVKGTAVYTSAFTPPTSPLTAIAGTSLLTCQSNRLIDDSINNFTITKVGDTRVSPAIPFGTPTTASYNTLYSTSFDGTGDYLTLSNNTLLGMGSGNFTIEFWMYQTALSNYRQILDVLDGNSVGRLILWVGSDGTLTNLGQSGNQRHSTASGAIVINTWTHVALVRSSGTTKFYINGTQSGSNYTDSTNYTCTTGTVYIGINSDGSTYPYIGYLSNFRMVKGTAVYTSAFTPPTTSLTAIANTSLLTCQNATLIDNSTNNFTITSFNQAQPIPVSPFTMTTSNVTVTSLGSAYFDGTGDYLSIASNPAHNNFGTSDFGVEGWFYFNSIAGTQLIFSHRNASAGAAAYVPFLLWTVTGTITVYASSDNGSWNVVNGSAAGTVIASQWYHIAYTRTGSTFRVFVNGVQTLTFTSSASFNCSQPFQVGMTGPGETNSAMNGYVSNVRMVKGTAVYTSNFVPPQTPLTAISGTSLLTLQYSGGANNNGFIDQSSFNNIIARNGNTTQGTFTPYSQNGWSNYFNGSSYLEYANQTAYSPGTGDFTLECWVYHTVAAGSNTWYVSHINGGVSFYRNTAGKLAFAKDAVAVIATSTNTLPVNTWTHVAVARSGTSFKMFINGSQEASVTDSTNITSTGFLDIGCTAGVSGAMTGYISNVRLVKGSALYTSAFTPSTTPLTPVTNTQLLICQSNRFVDNSPNNFAVNAVGGTTSVQAYSPFGGVTSTPISYSNYFDGTGDYLTTPANSAFVFGTSDFTIEAWIYRTVSSASYIAIITNWSTGWFFGFNNNTFTLLKSGGATVISDTVTSSLNSWNHYCVSRSGSTVRLFVDGVLKNTVTDTNDFSGSNTIYIGITDGVNHIFTGSISNLRVVKGTAVYTSNFTPSTTPLTAIANTSLLTCQSQTIIDNSSNYFAITATGNTVPKIFNPFGITNTTNVSYTPSVNGGSMYLDGSGDYLSTVSNAQFALSGNYTVELWVYSTITWAATTNFVNMNSGGFFLQYSSSSGLQIGVAGSSATATFATTLTINTWNHIAISRSSNSTKCFVNGTQVGNTSNDSTSYVQNGMYIGALWEGSQPLTGYMSNFRIVKGTAVYTSNFVPPITPLTNTATIGTSTYNSVLLINATSGGIIDYHGTNDLETVGNTQLAPQDPYGGSYYSNYSDGNADYLTVPSASWSTLAGTFTVEGWVKWNVTPATGNMTGVYTSGGWVLFNDGTRITPNVFGTGNIFNSTFLVSSVVLGKWYHIAVTRNSSNLMTMWVDGVSVGSTTTATTYTQGIWYIFSFNNTNCIQGNISNFRVNNTCLYTTTFTPSTVPLTAVSGTQLLTCQSNSFKDNSTNAVTLTAAGTVAVQSQNPFQQNTGKSIYFDGTGDSLKIIDNPNINFGSGDFTLECWVYFNVVNTEQVIFSKGWQSSSAYASYLIYMTSAASLRFGASSSGGSWDIANERVMGTMTAGSWTHIAVTRSGTSFRAFVNGVINNSFTFTSSSSLANIAAQTLFIGGRTDGNSTMNGYIDDLRITKGIARYTATFTPPTTPLLTN